MKGVQSYNKELQIATAQFKDALNNIEIYRFNVDDTVSSSINVPIKYGAGSIVLKSLMNPKKKIELPVISFSRSGFTVDQQKLFNFNNELTFTQDEEYTRNQPVPIDIVFEVIIYSMYPSDDDQIIQNFAPFSVPNFYVSWKHPYTDEPIKSQVVWSGDINTEYPIDFDTTNEPRIITTTTFTYKTWLFPGSNLGNASGRPKTDNCDLIRKVITEWYDSADAYALLEQGKEITHDDIEYNSWPKPYYAKPSVLVPNQINDISLFGSNFKETMLVYLTSTDEVLGVESPIIIEGEDSGMTGVLTEYVFKSSEKFVLEDISASTDTEVDVIIVSECGNYEKLSDNQGHKITIKRLVAMPEGDNYLATHNVNGLFVLPLVDGANYDFIIDWGDGSEIEHITSSTASHTYNDGEYTIEIGGVLSRLSFDLVPTSAHTLLRVDNLGATGLITLNGIFSNCTNLTTVSGGVFSVSDMTKMFNRCFALESFDYTSWNWASISNMTNFLANVELDHTYYSNFLIWLYNNTTQTNVIFSGGNSQYNNESTVKRFRFEQDRSWVVTDGGYYGEEYRTEYNIDVTDTTIRLPLETNNNYAFVVNWGDGAEYVIIEDPNSIDIFHTYAAPGLYVIEIKGIFESWLNSIANIEASFQLLYHIYDTLDLVLPLAEDGIYDFVVDWGDGSETNHITEWNDVNNRHIYASNNEYYVTITGICTKWLSTNKLDIIPFQMGYNVTSDDLFIELPLAEGFEYDFDVDWGDGTTDLIDSWDDPDKLHEYTHAGQYIISIMGLCEKFKTILEMAFLIYMDSNGKAVLIMDEFAEYDYNVDWGDGNTSEITAWDDSNRIHEYVSEDNYVIELAGDINGTVDIASLYEFNIQATVEFVNVTLVMSEFAEYDYNVDWGDGNTSEITAWDDSNRIHEYASIGEYNIVIEGSVDGSLSADAADPLVFNVTAEVDDDQATLIMDTNADYDFIVDWGDGESDTITSPYSANRIHSYTLADDCVITAHGLIGGQLTVDMRGEIVEPTIMGMMSYGNTYIDTELVPLSGFEFELDVKPISEFHDGRNHGIMGVETVIQADPPIRETCEFYRSRDTDETYGNVWGNPRFDGTYVPRDLQRHTWSKDGLTLSISDVIDNEMDNDNYTTDNPIYLFARNEVTRNVVDYYAKAIVYHLECWSDADRFTKTADWVPVLKGSTEFDTTPAPDHGYWDMVSEQYFVPAIGELHPVKEDIRIGLDRSNIGLASTSRTYIDTKIEINKGFSYELDCRYDHIGEPPDSGYAIMGAILFNLDDGLGHDYCELIRVKNSIFYHSFGHPALTENVGLADHDRHIISRIGNQYDITDVGEYTFNDNTLERTNHYLYQRNDGDNGAKYYGDWTIFSFRVWADPNQTELIQELLPIESGSTLYSTTPAPSNCFWDTVKEEYLEAIGGALSIVNDNAPVLTKNLHIREDSQVLFPYDDSHLITGDMSIELDVYVESVDEQGTMVLCISDGETLETNAVYGLRVNTNRTLWWLHEYGTGDNTIVNSTNTLNLKEWTHILVERNTTAKTISFTINNGAPNVVSYTNQAEIATTGNTQTLRYGSYFNGLANSGAGNFEAELIGKMKNVVIRDDGDIVVDTKLDEQKGNIITNTVNEALNGTCENTTWNY